jgi:hypothetical protein
MSVYATIELDESGHQDLPKEMDPNGDSLVYGQNIGQCNGIEELDAIATAAGAEPLSSFLDDSQMIDNEEREEMGMPPAEEKWRPIEEGIHTLEALIAEVSKRPAESPIGRYAAQRILWDLQASLMILKKAAPPDKLFRFVVC